MCNGRGVYNVEHDRFEKTRDHLCSRDRQLQKTANLKEFIKEAAQSNVSTCQEHLEKYQAE